MIAAEIVSGISLLALFLPDLSGDWRLFVMLLGLNLVAERYPISIYGESNITVGFVFTLPIMAFFGAPGVAVPALLEPTVRNWGTDTPLLLGVRRVCRALIVYSLAALCYGTISPIGLEAVTMETVAAGTAATAVTFGLSASLIILSVNLQTGQPFAAVWANHRWVALHYAAFGVVGIGFIAAYTGLGYLGLIAYVIPVVLLRISTKQYVDKTAENVSKLKAQNLALEKANIEIRSVSEELRSTYNATLEALVSALEARDQETKGHSVRVAHYMVTIAEALGVQPGTQEWLDMHHGALLHDVGKIGVRDSILLKPAKLTPDEWEYMRKHPEIGYNILRDVKFLDGAAEIVLAHHERWDGQGYPKGLRGEEIPLGSRIFMVVDTFDTMTSDRVYRKALSTREALEEILRCSGTQFDPMVVEAFLEIYDDWVLERERLHQLEAWQAAA
jgi:putative nucleotidyltransferase with HDIG domain